MKEKLISHLEQKLLEPIIIENAKERDLRLLEERRDEVRGEYRQIVRKNKMESMTERCYNNIYDRTKRGVLIVEKGNNELRNQINDIDKALIHSEKLMELDGDKAHQGLVFIIYIYIYIARNR